MYYFVEYESWLLSKTLAPFISSPCSIRHYKDHLRRMVHIGFTGNINININISRSPHISSWNRWPAVGQISTSPRQHGTLLCLLGMVHRGDRDPFSRYSCLHMFTWRIWLTLGVFGFVRNFHHLPPKQPMLKLVVWGLDSLDPQSPI